MRITTKLVLDMETGATIEHDFYEYDGPVARCKANSAETQLTQEQTNFYSTLLSDFNTQFGNQSAILKSITNAFTPILQAGPGQKGFTAPEEAAMRTGASDATAQAYKQASQAVNERMGSQGGGNAYLPSGAAAQVNAGLASQAAQANAAQQGQITQADYAQGLKNFQSAAAALGGAASMYNPSEYIGGANSAFGPAFNSQEQIQQQNTAWEGELASGLISAASAAFGGGGGGSSLFGGGMNALATPGSGFGSLPVTGSSAFPTSVLSLLGPQ